MAEFPPLILSSLNIVEADDTADILILGDLTVSGDIVADNIAGGASGINFHYETVFDITAGVPVIITHNIGITPQVSLLDEDLNVIDMDIKHLDNISLELNSNRTSTNITIICDTGALSQEFSTALSSLDVIKRYVYMFRNGI